MKLKDIKTNGYYVYSHSTPDGMVYYGVSQMQPCKRWQPNHYKGLSLEPYIQKFGWQNIEHLVIQDNLTKEEALKIEDALIQAAKENGNCINKQRSGLIRVSDVNAYQRQLYATNEGYRERKKAYNKQLNSTPEGKIYSRVANYNQNHPDRIIETPAEAKRKYLESGIIPDYIKSDDLN